MPSVTFEDQDLLNTIESETNFDMCGMEIIKKEIINDKLRVFYRPIR